MTSKRYTFFNVEFWTITNFFAVLFLKIWEEKKADIDLHWYGFWIESIASCMAVLRAWIFVSATLGSSVPLLVLHRRHRRFLWEMIYANRIYWKSDWRIILIDIQWFKWKIYTFHNRNNRSRVVENQIEKVLDLGLTFRRSYGSIQSVCKRILRMKEDLILRMYVICPVCIGLHEVCPSSW